MYASVAYVFKSVGANKTPKEKREPLWKRQARGKVETRYLKRERL